MRIPSTSTTRYINFVAVNSSDLKTRLTGLTTFTVYGSINGGTPTAFTTPTVVELSAANMPGIYALLLDEQTTLVTGHDTDELCLHITQASMAGVSRVVELYRSEFDVLDNLSTDLEIAETTVDAINADVPDVNVKAVNDVVLQGTGIEDTDEWRPA